MWLHNLQARFTTKAAIPRPRPLYRNESANNWVALPSTAASQVLEFHKSLPGYQPTVLASLEQIARNVGVKAVYIKNEGERLNLPSFKILGASWGTFRAVAENYNLPLDSELGVVKEALSSRPTTLYAATDGNHGRAVARMGKILGVDVEIYVPSGMHAAAVEAIRSEGATVTEIKGSYDEAVQVAFEAAKKPHGILIQDTAFPGYEEIPSWIVQGYGTMMSEIDEQVGDKCADLVIVPVGVGSFAQAVVTHYKGHSRRSRVLAVEPDTAACLHASLVKGECIPIETTSTIMTGLDCGTVSSIAWPILQSGVDASMTVSDFEAHKACVFLHATGVPAGPCGAAPLAALLRLTDADKASLGLDKSSVVVLLCTEGERPYKAPKKAHSKQISIVEHK